MVRISEMLKGIDEIKKSKKSLEVLIGLALNEGNLDLENGLWWMGSSKIKPLIDRLENANLVKRELKYDKYQKMDIEHLLLITNSKKSISKVLEKALITWSTEKYIPAIKRTKSKIGLHLFSILEKNDWNMSLVDLESELCIYRDDGAVRNHLSRLFERRLVYYNYEFDKIVVPKNVADSVIQNLINKRDKLNEEHEQLFKKAIQKWKSGIPNEQMLALQIISQKKIARVDLLKFLQEHGFWEMEAEDILYEIEDLPLVSVERDDGITYYSIAKYADKIVKKVLPRSKIKTKTPEKPQAKEEFVFLADDDLIGKSIEMIKTTKKQVVICCPWITSGRLQEPLIELVEKKKKLTIYHITHHGTQDFVDGLRDRLMTTNMDLYNNLECRRIRKLHCKIVLKDKNEVLISSKNLTDSDDRDAGVWSCNAEIVQRAYKFVERLPKADDRNQKNISEL